jgi:hypothetical protein
MDRWRNTWRWLFLLLGGLVAGCGTTRTTDTPRSATEQLLISKAVDETIGEMDFRILAGKTVFFDAQYLDATIVDRNYLISSLRQHLLASGALLQEDRTKATYVVEARAGAMGTDRSSVLVGVPQMAVPVLVPGQPSQIPEIPIAKWTDQKGIAKIAVYAYNRQTGRPVLQSGVLQASSTADDSWILGMGPFQSGTIRRSTEFAGKAIEVPFFERDHEESVQTDEAVPTTTQAVTWTEPTTPAKEPLPAAAPTPAPATPPPSSQFAADRPAIPPTDFAKDRKPATLPMVPVNSQPQKN